MEECFKKGWKRQPPRASIDHSKASVFFHVIAIAAVTMSFLPGNSWVYAQARSITHPPIPFVESAEYDTAIPSPASVIDHEVAERPVRYSALIRYMRTLADSSDRVILTSYGRKPGSVLPTRHMQPSNPWGAARSFFSPRIQLSACGWQVNKGCSSMPSF